MKIYIPFCDPVYSEIFRIIGENFCKKVNNSIEYWNSCGNEEKVSEAFYNNITKTSIRTYFANNLIGKLISSSTSKNPVSVEEFTKIREFVVNSPMLREVISVSDKEFDELVSGDKICRGNETLVISIDLNLKFSSKIL